MLPIVHGVIANALLILAGLGGAIVIAVAITVFRDCRIIYQGKLKEVCPYKRNTCPYKVQSPDEWNTEETPHEQPHD